MRHWSVQSAPKIGLPVVLIAYLALVTAQASPSWFGYYHDDSLYLTAARSLASGDGYRMASVPGEPLQTKYPVAFPWLLSLVWRAEPSFPANLDGLLWLVRLSGAVFLAGAFFLLRQLGLGPWPSLAITALCAVHPIFEHLSGLLLSDVPFTAAMVWGLVCAQRAFDQEDSPLAWRWWTAALVLAAAATQLRTIGIALPAGVALTAAWRRRWIPAGLCSLACLALLAVPLASSWSAGNSSATAGSGYGQTMQFYRSYLSFWRSSTPDWSTFLALLSFNFRDVVKSPAVLTFMIPSSRFSNYAWQPVAVVLSFLIAKGLIRQLWPLRHPLLAVAALYAAVVLIWNYSLIDRFFAWALPLFMAGMFWEARRLAGATRDLFARRAPLLDRAVAAAFMAALAAVALYGVHEYAIEGPRTIAAGEDERARLQAEKERAYDWILAHTGSSDRFIAYEDASLYLFTGRQALRPMAFSTAAFYLQSKAPLDHDLERLSDVACHIGARYWLASSDDYHLESGQEMIQKSSAELLSGRPEVFASPSGEVRIYDLSALTGEGGQCSRPMAQTGTVLAGRS